MSPDRISRILARRERYRYQDKLIQDDDEEDGFNRENTDECDDIRPDWPGDGRIFRKDLSND